MFCIRYRPSVYVNFGWTDYTWRNFVPLNGKAQDLLMQAPNFVTEHQLNELHIKIDLEEKKWNSKGSDNSELSFWYFNLMPFTQFDIFEVVVFNLDFSHYKYYLLNNNYYNHAIIRDNVDTQVLLCYKISNK